VCKAEGANEIEQRSLCYFRFFVYREYREIRYLGNRDMARYDKSSDRSPDLYELARQDFARLWHEVLPDTRPDLITKPFEDRTHLTLQQTEEAFRLGEWYPFTQTKKNYGGLKHADIVSHTLRLGDAMAEQRWKDKVPEELAVLRDIQHNRPRPARLDYESLVQDLVSLGLMAPPAGCCLLDAS
jgi:hypothetical protein